MSTRPNGSHDQPGFKDMSIAPVLYALARARLHPTVTKVRNRWSDVMDWWYGSIPTAELIRRTGRQVSELLRKGVRDER